MKILKLLFSKILIVFLLLLLQVGIICAAVLLLENFIIFQIASVIVALLLFFHIVNKRECPDFKIPWLVLLFLFPFFTIMVYILFANQKVSRRDAERLRAVFNETRKFTGTPSDPAPSDTAAAIGNYLSKNSFMFGRTGNRVKYFPLGEEFLKDLLAELEGAEKFIFMEYFIISRGKAWDAVHEILARKAKQGVEVRLIYDDIGTVGLLKCRYYKKLRKEGIDCYKFNPFRPIISGIHNNRDHRKITVIDGKTAYTGGVNIGDEYMNLDNRLGHFKDTAIKLQGSAVDNFTALFLQLFDANAKRQPENYDKYFSAEHETYPDGGYVHPFGDGPRPFYPEQVGENNYINMINSAKKYCYISTPYLIPDYNLTTAIRNAAYRGVDIRIITPSVPDKRVIFNITRSNYSYLMQAGVKIYEYSPGFIHAKMLVADDELAFVGTINLDYRSLVHHFECGAVLCGVPCIKDIKDDFESTFKSCKLITHKNFKMGKLATLANTVLKMFSPML